MSVGCRWTLTPVLEDSYRCEQEKTAARFLEKGKAFVSKGLLVFLLSTNKMVQSASKMVQSTFSRIVKLRDSGGESLFLAWHGRASSKLTIDN